MTGVPAIAFTISGKSGRQMPNIGPAGIILIRGIGGKGLCLSISQFSITNPPSLRSVHANIQFIQRWIDDGCPEDPLPADQALTWRPTTARGAR